MSKKDKTETKQDEAELKDIYLPTLGVTVRAASTEEAIALANEQKDEGSDGNV